ncbi:MAG TPA: glycosyltransferase family 4 protein [Pyrinomonadaceae bacterium]|jgi:glycosyltransferase involved in cell wall biosynthesis|nr:glycosyltransferase family 4 protein [Pyrinomonadaceae bacterium]
MNRKPPRVRVLMGMPDRESLGGPAACEPPFVAELQRLGAEVVEETYVYGERLGGTTLRQRILRVLSTARRLRRRLRREGDFDIVHLNSSFDTMALMRDAATLRLLRPTRAKIFIKFHGSDAALFAPHASAFRRALVRFVLKHADGIGLLSSEERENFARAGVDRRKLFVVKNVVTGAEEDEGESARLTHGASSTQSVSAPETADSASLRAKLNVAGEATPLLLFIARFIPAKGLSDVIDACAILRDAGREFELLCLGDGEARAAAEAQAARLNLTGRVRFFGYVPEAETGEFYAGGTMLVFPTYHYEGFPMVIFKSIAAGLPVITTRIRAAADYLREPQNCLWVAPQNPQMLAEKIIQLLDRTDTRASMRRNNLELARQFTARVVAPEYLEIYNQLVESVTSKP